MVYNKLVVWRTNCYLLNITHIRFLIFLMVRKLASNFRIDINSEQIKTFEVSVTPFAQNGVIKGIK